MHFLFLFLLLWCSVEGKSLDEFFQDTDAFQRAHAGACFIDLETKKVVCRRNEEQFFIPASIQKVITGDVALAVFGADHRFYTDLALEGEVDASGTLQGNIWVIGGGDPTLDLDIFSEWEKALKKEGVQRISGKIYVDTSCFEEALAAPSWSFEDLGNYYGVGASGVTLHQNAYQITFQPGKREGDPAAVIKREPEVSGLTIFNEVRTGSADSGDQVNVFGMEYSPIQFYRGTVPVNEPTFSVRAAIPDPPLFCGQMLKRRIGTTGDVQVIRQHQAFPPRRVILRKSSPPLKEIVQRMNLVSNNLFAEALLKTLGKGERARGTQEIEAFLKKKGIVAQIKDGAGLSRQNLVTPLGMATLLAEIPTRGLPEPGKEGSLKSFPPLSGATLQAKTGSLGGVYNLAGYLTLSSGKRYAFCLCCNQYRGPIKEIREKYHLLLEEFCQKLISSPSNSH